MRDIINADEVIWMSIKKLPHNHGHIDERLEYGAANPKQFSVISDLFKMLSDEKRIQIFWLLCHCEECVINISTLLDMSPPAVSHHLKLLKSAGLIISRREGKEVYYTIAQTPRSQALHNAIEEIIEIACPTDETFKSNDTYDSQIQTVNAIHSFLTENIEKRYTIEELSAMFLIIRTTLKITFKKVFGKPVATYMKEFRIKKAEEMLTSSDKPISEISRSVGYENQSKFTRAFKEVTGYLPKDFRKMFSK